MKFWRTYQGSDPAATDVFHVSEKEAREHLQGIITDDPDIQTIDQALEQGLVTLEEFELPRLNKKRVANALTHWPMR